MTPSGRLLLERAAETATIGHQLDAACAGEGGLIVLEGPAGIGKTALLRAAVDQAKEKGMQVLRARGTLLERQIEWGVVRQLVERPVLAAEEGRRAELLAGPAAPAAAVLGLADLPHDDGSDRSADLLHALHWLVVNLAEEGPLFLAIDDAQWGDAVSLRAGGYLAHRLDGLPVSMLVSVREGEGGRGTRVLSEMLAAAGPAYLRPQPLSPEAATELARNAFGGQEPSPEFVSACLGASGGNPFFITELISELALSGRRLEEIGPEAVGRVDPPTIRHSLLLRLGGLGADARALAQALATLGGDAELRHVAAVAGLAEPDAAAAVDRLVAASLVEGGQRLRFPHSLVQTAIAEEIPVADWAEGHRRAFELLSAEGAVDEVVASHALEAVARGDAAVSGLLERTAEQALRAGSPASAAVHLARALAEPAPADKRGPLLAALGKAEFRAGAFTESLGHLDRAVALLGEGSGLLDAHRDRAGAAFSAGGIADARGRVGEAIAAIGESDPDGALQLEADLALLEYVAGGRPGPDLNLARHADATGETRAQRTMLALLALDAMREGSAERAIELAERALGAGRMVIEDGAETIGWQLATNALIFCERFDSARATIADALADGHRRGSTFARSGALGCRTLLASAEGRPRDAEADARTILAGAAPPALQPVYGAYLAIALVEQGDLEGAAGQIASAGIAEGDGGGPAWRVIPWARALLWAAQGRLDRLRADVSAMDHDDRAGTSVRPLPWKSLLAIALARVGEGEEARGLAAEQLEWARAWGRPAALGIAQRAAALAAERDDRSALMAEAVATLSGSALVTEEARARVDLGTLLLREGRKRDGIAALEHGLELAVGAGVRDAAAAAAAELEVAGAAPKRLGFDELTASERRIAELAGGGMTNRAIAEELFVTPKTVENHLTRVYAKLEIASRTELSAAL